MEELFTNQQYSYMWTAIGAIGQAAASILAIVALILSIKSFQKTLHTSHYGELDRMYFDLLRTALEKPHVTKPKATRTDDQNIEYDIYAFMVWNFIEAIYDRCENNKNLTTTWYPVVDAENRLHWEWLADDKNKRKFKRPFLDFIQSGIFKQQ